MSRAHDLFLRALSEGDIFIKYLINESITEELFLDYKCVDTKNGSGKLSDSDKKNLSKAVSGFGNSSGGIVIWGVDCRGGDNQGDIPRCYQSEQASGRMSRFDPTWFKSLIEGMTSGVTIPAHKDVRHLAIFRDGRQDEGVVVTYIPKCEYSPLRSISSSLDNYYVRIGSDFVHAPHDVLAALFGRRPQPFIDVTLDLTVARLKHVGANTPLWLSLDVKVNNSGRGIAEDIYFLFDIQEYPAFRCHESPFSDYRGWQEIKTSDENWNGPQYAIATHQKNKIPPGGSIVLNFSLTNRSISDFVIKISAGCATGTGSTKEIRLPQNIISGIVDLWNYHAMRECIPDLVISEINKTIKHSFCAYL